MSDVIDVLRAIVRDELRMLKLADVGVVTAVFPHAEGDTHNHECSVRLREGALELRKVPIATPHVGMVSAPRVGDLVLLSYVGGDVHRPVVTGRLYSNQANPPEHGEDELVLQVPLGGETSLRFDQQQSVIVTTGKNEVTIFKDGNVEVSAEGELVLTVKGNVDLRCTDCTIDASGEINLGKGGHPVITEGSHKCYYSGAPLVGASSVKAKP